MEGTTKVIQGAQKEIGDLRVPHHCLTIDAHWNDVLTALRQCVSPTETREQLTESLQQLWMTEQNSNHVLPCLCVRTALDLYFRIMKYPPGSEVIMSAINIPDMAHVINHHGLRIVPIDVNIDTLSPKVEILESLINNKTVAVLVAHIYGKWFEMDDIVKIAHKYNLHVLEDCAEGFRGVTHSGHPDTDIALFSFGVIKTASSFGGAIVRIRDKNLYESMRNFYATYPTQSHSEYFKKVVKYSGVKIIGDTISESMTYFIIRLSKFFHVDHNQYVVSLLRGFPKHFWVKIRQQPSTAVLHMLHRRISGFHESCLQEGREKGDYVTGRLPSTAGAVGKKAFITNYWLFPILVQNPKEVIKELNVLGIDAVTGPTQLKFIEPYNGNNSIRHLNEAITHYPHEAKFLMDHLLYLPVHKNVPYHHLDKIILALEITLQKYEEFQLPSLDFKQLFVNGTTQGKLPIPKSKL